MSLREYKKKRKFHQTPEPDDSVDSGKNLHFVIQKHAASHLHYDFRLEIKGILKSWAIPKGPSLNPEDKRLAIMVEDHPYKYKDFEGVIPKGNYGAGNVLIWDEGSYESATSEKTLQEQLKKGHLSITVYGKKLRGKFNLVKLRKAEKNTWLLIKAQDKFSSESDILKKDKSVRSGLKINQIDADNIEDTSPIKSHKKKQLSTPIHNITMPKKVYPMLATLIDKPFNDPNWWFEIKWDGYRIIAFVNHKTVVLRTRDHKDYTDNYHPVVEDLEKLDIRAIFDGEMVVVDESGRSHFQLLQDYQKMAKGNLVYYIFDLLWLNGRDLRSQPLYQRKNLLEKFIPFLHHVKISEHIVEMGEEFFKVALGHGLEGIMAKEFNSPYTEKKRSLHWLKIKAHHQQEAVICGYTAPRGSRRHIGALVLGVYEKGELMYIGHTGGRLSATDLEHLKQRLDRLAQPESPFKHVPKTNAPVTWVKPQLVCEVSFNEWTAAGHLRQPIYMGMRVDKLARSVRREKEMPIKKIDRKNPKKIKKSIKQNTGVKNQQNDDGMTVTINRHPLHLTHLSKIYWPEDGYTKYDLITYYRSVAKIILPYLKNRPESLNRHPNGIEGQHFFQKNVEYPPHWIKTKTIYSASEEHDIQYLLCQNEATLVYMANLGCIEINPWFSQLKSLDKPDFCVIDLDPEDIEFSAVIKVAQVAHKLLDDIGAANYCKTSGATGLHICIPLGAKYSYDQSRKFIQLIVTLIHSELPDITSIVRSPKQRQGKVYLDFLQNSRGQTIVAPYSVRPRPGAPVSTPLLWKEVRKGLNIEKFNIKTMAKRLEKLGDIWKPVLGRGISLDKCLKNLQKTALESSP